MAYISSISRLPIFGDDFDLLVGGKNAGRILKLLVRESNSGSIPTKVEAITSVLFAERDVASRTFVGTNSLVFQFWKVYKNGHFDST